MSEDQFCAELECARAEAAELRAKLSAAEARAAKAELDRDNLSRALFVSCGGVRPIHEGHEVCIDGSEPTDGIEITDPWGDHIRYRRKYDVVAALAQEQDNG